MVQTMRLWRFCTTFVNWPFRPYSRHFPKSFLSKTHLSGHQKSRSMCKMLADFRHSKRQEHRNMCPHTCTDITADFDHTYLSISTVITAMCYTVLMQGLLSATSTTNKSTLEISNKPLPTLALLYLTSSSANKDTYILQRDKLFQAKILCRDGHFQQHFFSVRC